jgi:hypothetical protein
VRQANCLPEHPWHPRFAPCYEPSFDHDKAELGLAGPNFDHFFRSVEVYVGDYPWEYSKEVPDSDGIRMLPTRRAFPDIPALYVYYRVEQNPNKIIYLGLSPAWSQAEVFSLDDLLGPDS